MAKKKKNGLTDKEFDDICKWLEFAGGKINSKDQKERVAGLELMEEFLNALKKGAVRDGDNINAAKINNLINETWDRLEKEQA